MSVTNLLLFEHQRKLLVSWQLSKTYGVNNYCSGWSGKDVVNQCLEFAQQRIVISVFVTEVTQQCVPMRGPEFFATAMGLRGVLGDWGDPPKVCQSMVRSIGLRDWGDPAMWVSVFVTEVTKQWVRWGDPIGIISIFSSPILRSVCYCFGVTCLHILLSW